MVAVNVDPFALPFVTLPERASLPAKHGIYFAISKDDEILYIGRAIGEGGLNARWKARLHHRYLELESISGVRIAYLIFDDISNVPDIEETLIRELAPKLNKVKRNLKHRLDKPRLQITLDEEERKMLEDIAKKRGQSLSRALGLLVREKHEEIFPPKNDR